MAFDKKVKLGNIAVVLICGMDSIRLQWCAVPSK